MATVDRNDTVHHDAAVAVQDDRIAAVGPSQDIVARFPGAEVVDGAGKVVMPGFANIHTHFTLTIAKGIYEDLSPPHKPPFTSGLAPLPVPELIGRGDDRVMVRLAALEAIRSGTTAILEDAHRHRELRASDLADTGLRFLLRERAWDKAKGTIGDPGAVRGGPQRSASAASPASRRLHAKWHGMADGRIRVGVSAWAPDMCSPELLARRLRALQEKLDTVATIHLNQIWGEVAAVKAVRDRLPTEYLADLGFPQRSPDLPRTAAAWSRGGGTAARRGANVTSPSTPRSRRAAGSSPRIADLEAVRLQHRHGHRQHGRGHGRGDAHRPVHGARAPRGRPPADARAGACAGRRSTATARWAFRTAARSIPGNKADLIMIDLRRAHLVPRAARGLRLRAPGTGTRRRGE